METDRVSKADYKDRVQLEKKKLRKQVIILTFIAFAIAAGFYAVLATSNPYATAAWCRWKS